MKGPIDDLVKLLSRLPGIGKKSASRIAYFLLQSSSRYPEDLAGAIIHAREAVKPCPVCGRPAESSPCEVCADPGRDHSTVMVLESPEDLDAIEAAAVYTGVYHVLGGVISPLAGRGPEILRVKELMDRIESGGVKEVILATNPSSEGDATQAYLSEELSDKGVRVTRLARGIPAGSELRYLDPISLETAVKDRREK